ncbi:hypothetical protein [Corynebacterium sp. A21]|uniref:hypothetical protein n=1 Tax=Corynebacterium sp. A21 TaxID=3457318 RepID=UPI003FCFF75F
MTAPSKIEWLTADEVIARWGIHRSTLTGWSHKRKVNRQRDGKRYIYRADEIAKAYYASRPTPGREAILEEVEFFLGFGSSLSTVVEHLANSYRVRPETIRDHLKE